MPVAVVTDSTACLTHQLAEGAGVLVVPLHIESARDSISDVPDQRAALMSLLRGTAPLHTSRPSPLAFAEAFDTAVQAGATGLVSAHLSADLSGTWASAALAARSLAIPVRAVDSRTMGAGLGLAVLAGAQRAGAGGGLDEVADVVRSQARASRSYFLVESLEPLRRGGRIGAAATVVGDALAVRPILGLVDGHVVAVERLRTGRFALARLVDRVAREAGPDQRLVVHHLDAPELADQTRVRLARALREGGLTAGEIEVQELSAAIGVHVGVGALGVVLAPAPG